MTEENAKLEQIIDKFNAGESTLIGLLQDITAAYRYLPEDVLNTVAERLNIPIAKLYGLATFYKSFRLEPMGRHHVCVCLGTACHVKGAEKIVDSLERDLEVKAGQTTLDKNITLETLNCVGACALAPLAIVDGEFHGKMDQKSMSKLVGNLNGHSEN